MPRCIHVHLSTHTASVSVLQALRTDSQSSGTSVFIYSKTIHQLELYDQLTLTVLSYTVIRVEFYCMWLDLDPTMFLNETELNLNQDKFHMTGYELDLFVLAVEKNPYSMILPPQYR
ncbi:hypothetical protein GOODEAATRI_023247 [Goodea atripinnis]|uniref:Uncharacterized protein n=1 Tax=Goodea atripinnis TaxID=208336 RepID=A0ABV0Q0C7_9TELE